jgi:hypothetical protein
MCRYFWKQFLSFILPCLSIIYFLTSVSWLLHMIFIPKVVFDITLTLFSSAHLSSVMPHTNYISLQFSVRFFWHTVYTTLKIRWNFAKLQQWSECNKKSGQLNIPHIYIRIKWQFFREIMHVEKKPGSFLRITI